MLADQPRAVAAPGCADYIWIGAAGSGERDGAAKFQNNGMGNYINRSYLDFKSEAKGRGFTVSQRALDYRARKVPIGESAAAWADFRASAVDGVAKLKQLISTVASQCPSSKLVLAGYSQGASVVHRVLQQRSVPRLAGGLLLADPDRLTYDSVEGAGTAAIPVAGAIVGQGAAQSIPSASYASSRRISSAVGNKFISYCQIQDPVCSFNPGIAGVTYGLAQAVGLPSHTSYIPEWWRLQLADKILPAGSSPANRFVGTWVGDVTQQMGGGGLNLYGAIADLHQRGNAIGGTLSFVRTRGNDGSPGYCTWTIEKSTINGNLLSIDGRKVQDTGDTCSGWKAQFTHRGSSVFFKAKGQGILYRIR
ncbi:cutinase [Gordonia terrae C-6]|uniref:Cutinase n=1 Tax=Gordonia terrae C-6 TaxID=1316928 RepID=R7YCR2_9ACTN|nr:cutinase [Gordonia terrae C-6]